MSRLALYPVMLCMAVAGFVAHAEVHLPEPLLFDLVRPLGAQKGELEINTLAVRGMPGKRALEWAPEVEYAFRKGWAVELELPMEGRHLEFHKFALQGTLGAHGERFIHGWQTIGLVGRGGRRSSGDVLYLAGGRLNERWSVSGMVGARNEPFNKRLRRFTPVNNTLLSREVGRRTVFGMETNVVGGGREQRHRLLMPQTHFRLSQGWTVQMGLGREWPAKRPGATIAALRLVRQLR
jgi:hypothetical protein